MPALKDISQFRAFANTAFAKSPLWSMPAKDIIPAQLVALKARLKLEGHSDTEWLFKRFAMSLDAVKRTGELSGAPILKYATEARPAITSRALREGFGKMTRPTPAAILFALESKLEPERVSVLKWVDVKGMHLNAYATQIINAQPRHIAGKYVFWRQSRIGQPEAVFDLEIEVFDKLDMVWAELQLAYATMQFTD